MKKYFFILTGLIALSACQQRENTAVTDSDSLALDTNIVPVAKQQCYSYIKNRDTATLTLITSGAIATGELNYKLFEKDSNKGMIKGNMHGDTLLVDYHFSSEGKESIRQVAFLKKGEQLLEGTGDIEEKNGKMIFKNTKNLTFGQSIIFDKTDCK